MTWQRECELWPLRDYAGNKLAGYDLDDDAEPWPTRVLNLRFPPIKTDRVVWGDPRERELFRTRYPLGRKS